MLDRTRPTHWRVVIVPDNLAFNIKAQGRWQGKWVVIQESRDAEDEPLLQRMRDTDQLLAEIERLQGKP